MLRFTIRDMHWLTAIIGLAIVWRLENLKAHNTRQTLSQAAIIADEAALAGRWQIVAITSSGVSNPVATGGEASMSFDSGYWRLDYSGAAEDWEYKLVRPGEINFDSLATPGGFKAIWKWRYELKDGKLRMIRSSNPAERPTDFDAVSDPSQTLYELKKARLEPDTPAAEPQPAATGRDI
jgi:uncharacterized protein (TIGR03067 family)